MNIPVLVSMLKRHEGERLKPYTDTVGKLTIGVGRDLTDVGISEDESETLLVNDIGAVLADLETFEWWRGLSESRQLALADMRFNLGEDGFRQFRHMIHALAVGDWAAAANEMRNSQWKKQVGARADEDAQLVEQG